MHNGKETLVLGGTGKTGRRVAERLTRRGMRVRIGSRSGMPRFNWENPATWPAAVEGVASAYVSYYPDLAFPGAADAVQAFVELAVRNGVGKFVLLSGRGEEGALRGEEAIQNSGVEWSIVRASRFFQSFSEHFMLEPVIAGEVAFPAGQIAEPFIDSEDVADVAAAALLDDRHTGQLYEVTGPRLLTFGEAIERLLKQPAARFAMCPSRETNTHRRRGSMACRTILPIRWLISSQPFSTGVVPT